MVMQSYALFVIHKSAEHEPDPIIQLLLGGIAVMLLLLTQFLLRYKMRLTTEALSAEENNTKLRMQWQALFVFIMASNEASFLFGWVLCFMGTPADKAGILMGMAFLSQLSFYPTRP